MRECQRKRIFFFGKIERRKENCSVPREHRILRIDPSVPFSRCEKALFFLFLPPVHCSRFAFCFHCSSIRLAVATTAANDISMSDDLCFQYSLPSQSVSLSLSLSLSLSPLTPFTSLLHTVSRLIGHCLINWPCYFY